MKDEVPGAAPELRIDGRVATITMRRPTVANRLEVEDLELMRAQIDEVNAAPEVLVLRLRGEGRHFCSGFNIRRVGHAGDAGDAGGAGGSISAGERFEALAEALEHARPVTVAAIQGGVYGGATDLALACDFRVGAPGCEMSVPAAKLGILFYRGGLERYVSRLGLRTAKRLLLTAEKLSAGEMLACGFLDRLAGSPAEFDPLLDALTGTLTGMAPLALLGMKKHLNRIANGHLDADAHARDMAAADASQDLREGALAWQQKRPPVFVGH